MASTSSEVWASDLGLIPYQEAWKLQQELLLPVASRKIPDVIFFLEHPHVYTLGRHGKEENLLLTEAQLREKGVQFFRVDRGGDITYHGPGQLVVYFIFLLDTLGVRLFVEFLENTVIDLLASYGIKGERITGKPGVWVNDKKICSIGIAVKQGVTQHGLALNVNADLSYFSYINPCGKPNLPVTSMKQELKEPLKIPEIIHRASLYAEKRLRRPLRWKSPEEILRLLDTF
jgi:lipoyl(octanoyl) transferase